MQTIFFITLLAASFLLQHLFVLDIYNYENIVVMKGKVLTILCLLLAIFPIISEASETNSEKKAKFASYISGVRYAIIDLSPQEQANVDANGSVLLYRLVDYLEEMGIEKVALTTWEKQYLKGSVESLCDIVHVSLYMELVERSFYTNHQLTFTSCLGDNYQFSSKNQIPNDQVALNAIFMNWKQMYEVPMNYRPAQRLQLPVSATKWSGADLRSYFDSGNLDQVEGMYEKIVSATNKNQYSVAIVKSNNGGYVAVYLGGATNFKDWQVGEVMGELIPTATANLFKASWRKQNKAFSDQVYIELNAQNMLMVTFNGDQYNHHQYMKLYPQELAHNKEIQPISTGTGLAISSQGYILTNNHVVEDGQRFVVGINTQRTYNAVVIARDRKNDLAVLKISDPMFSGLPTIPYCFKQETASAGQSVFTLGYPLAGTMGWEVKYTDGAISALSGFEGDVSTYQTSVPVSPGSSGGPLFDKEGNLIGIIKAKHSQAPNATYVIKTRNINNVLDVVPEKLTLQPSSKKGSFLGGMKVEDQIESLKPFVFFVKVY